MSHVAISWMNSLSWVGDWPVAGAVALATTVAICVRIASSPRIAWVDPVLADGVNATCWNHQALIDAANSTVEMISRIPASERRTGRV